MKKRIVFILVFILLGGIVLMSGCVDTSEPIVINEEVCGDIDRNITTTTFQDLGGDWRCSREKATGRVIEMRLSTTDYDVVVLEDGYLVTAHGAEQSGKWKIGSMHEIITETRLFTGAQYITDVKIVGY